MTRLIVFHGPSCAGKTTVSKNVWKSLKRAAYLNIDSFKWFVWDEVAPQERLELAGASGVLLCSQYLNAGYDVIIDKAFVREEYARPFIEAAKSAGAEVCIYHIEAPLKELLDRFEKRTAEQNGKNPNRRTTLTRKRVEEIYENYKTHKFPGKRTFDSSKMSVAEITEQVLRELCEEDAIKSQK